MSTPLMEKRSQRISSPASPVAPKSPQAAKERRRSIPRLILSHISAKSPGRTAAATASLAPRQNPRIGDCRGAARKILISGDTKEVVQKAHSLAFPQQKSIVPINKRSYSQPCHNSSPPTIRSKPQLIRTSAVDETTGAVPDNVGTSIDSSTGTTSKSSKMKKFSSDMRSHLLLSFFAKHFGKTPKKTNRRPLGVSLSCDLEERLATGLSHSGQAMSRGTIIPGSAGTNSRLNCLHCLIDLSLRKHKFVVELRNADPMVRLWSSLDAPCARGAAGTCYDNSISEGRSTGNRININSNSADVSSSTGVSSSNNEASSSAIGSSRHQSLSTPPLSRKIYASSGCLATGLQRNNQTNRPLRTKSLNSLKRLNFGLLLSSMPPSSSLPTSSFSSSSSSLLSSSFSSSTSLTISDNELLSVAKDDYRDLPPSSFIDFDFPSTNGDLLLTEGRVLAQTSSQIEQVGDLFRRALAKSPVAKRVAAAAAAQSSQLHDIATPVCKHRTKNYWLDSKIRSDEHIWLPSSGPGTVANSSRDTECYVGERDCRKVGEKQNCAACHIVAHTACLPLLRQLHMKCKMTYREDSPVKKQVGASSGSDGPLTRHHWVHKWKHEGRCLRCGKSFQQKIFREKEVIAISCSWCKRSYHNKVGCFSSHCFEETCDRGDLKEVIVPPAWIQLTNLTKRRNRKDAPKRRRRRMFTVRPQPPQEDGPCWPSQPLLVFVNPKSGGNKGSKLLNTFCWLLNPRQVFDITALKGPQFGLDMFKKVATNMRLLVCGGDGTVGWVLSTLDKMKWVQYPPIGIVPLGTGNDLARCLGWGGSFSEEPLVQLLNAVIHETSVTHLDRWSIKVDANLQSPNTQADEIDEAAQGALPLTVMNNYFSIGADAHVALQFHHSRSANPQMLNSRLKNRIAYGGLGTIDLFKRTWKLLHEYITLECDGVDLTSKIKEFKFHCILFHNITYYAGGTVPWGNDSDEGCRPSNCDGRLEVLGFTTATLATLQMGGKGERIAQCSQARITTTKAIPMQVDGEPCLLAPSTIEITFHSQVPMLRREKKTSYTPASLRKQSKMSRQQLSSVSQTPSTPVSYSLPVLLTGSSDYHTNRDHLEQLKEAAVEIGAVCVEAEAELDSVRQKIVKLIADCPDLNIGPNIEWRFLDYVSSVEEGVFRVKRNQEQLSTLSDICCLDECIIIVANAFIKPIQPAPPDVAATELRKNISYDDICSNGSAVHVTFRTDTQEAHL